MSNNTSGNGIGFFGMLGIAFVVLKLCGVIDWSWWFVTMPFYLPFLIVAPIVLYVLFVKTTMR